MREPYLDVKTDRLDSLCGSIRTMRGVSEQRRNQQAREAIIAAAVDVCVESGYDGASIEAIARRAGSGKQTIYRWWPSKAALLHEALNDALGTSTAFPDTGDIAADMRTQMTNVVAFLSHPRLGSVYRALIAAAQSDPKAAASLLEELVDPRRFSAVDRLRRAQAAGQLDPGIDPEIVMELLYGPLYYRLLITGDPITPAFAAELVELVITRLGTPATAR